MVHNKHTTQALGTENQVLERLDRHTFRRIEGGHQLDTIYISDDLAVCSMRRRTPIWWEPETKNRLAKMPLVGLVYNFLRKHNGPVIFGIKQVVKNILAFVSRSPKAGPFAMIKTLKNYHLATHLEDLIEPFMILDRVTIKLKKKGIITIAPALVREECSTSLHDELCSVLRDEDYARAKELIYEALELDQQMWERCLYNVDFSFKNLRMRHGEVVLRDAGQMLNNHQHIIWHLEFLQEMQQGTKEKYNPIMKNMSRMIKFSHTITDYYKNEALKVYCVENFNKRWGLQPAELRETIRIA